MKRVSGTAKESEGTGSPPSPPQGRRKGGPPRKRPDLRRLEELAGDCVSKTSICALLGISMDTFERRIREANENPEEFPESAAFAAAFARGFARGEAKNAKVISRMSLSDAEMARFKAKCQYGWKDTSRLEHSGPGGGPIPVAVGKNPTMEKMDGILAGLRRSVAAEGRLPAGDGTGEPVDPGDPVRTAG